MTSIAIQNTGSYPVNNTDRFGLTLFIALALHAIIILGLSFDLSDADDASTISTMEITLVHSRSREAPTDADYLAQSNQIGGGNMADKVRPSSPFSNPQPSPSEGFAPESRKSMSPPPMKKATPQDEVMTVTQGPRRIYTKPQVIPRPPQPKSPTAAQLFERSREVARLNTEIDRVKRATEQNPRHTYVIGANAREYRFASYLHAWRAKVERIGRLNYPQAAIRDRLSGSLLMDVGINHDGSIHSIKIRRSSGIETLDQASIKTVKLAAPFAPLPEDIRKETDVLHIPFVYIWELKGGLSITVK